MVKISKYDASSYLDSKELMACYLTDVLQDGDTDELLQALENIAKAKGMMQVAKDTGLRRESLYKTLSSGSKPRFESVA
jgi:probable addiction module antidote protein